MEPDKKLEAMQEDKPAPNPIAPITSTLNPQKISEPNTIPEEQKSLQTEEGLHKFITDILLTSDQKLQITILKEKLLERAKKFGTDPAKIVEPNLVFYNIF